MTAPAVTAWAIKAPDGKIFRSTIAPTRVRAIKQFCEYGDRWPRWYKKGWRCVKVQITEMEEGE